MSKDRIVAPPGSQPQTHGVPPALYHVTTPEMARKYRSSKQISGPVRGFDTLAAALIWAMRKRRTVLYRITGGPMYPMPDHHLPEGHAWWIDADVTEFECVRTFTAAELPKAVRQRASGPKLFEGPISLSAEQARALLEPAPALATIRRPVERLSAAGGQQPAVETSEPTQPGLTWQDMCHLDQAIVLSQGRDRVSVRVVKHRTEVNPPENTPRAVELASELLRQVSAQVHGTHPRPKRIYLATPYSHDDRDVRLARFAAVNRLAALIVNKHGHIVHSPISHSHPVAMAGRLPTNWEFWEAYDRSFIEWADELWIFRTPGWDTSTGVTGEMNIAHELGKPVRMVHADGSVESGTPLNYVACESASAPRPVWTDKEI